MNAPHRKILLVDDDALVQRIYGRQLEQAGYHVLSAANGEEALEIAGRESLELIILDIDLPEKGGLAVLRELKGKEKTKGIQVIVITCVADYRLCREAARGSGATAFMTKPFSRAQLMTEVRKALGSEESSSGDQVAAS